LTRGSRSDIFWVETRGGCMRPFLSSRSRLVPLLKTAVCRAGDVALCGEPDRAVLHRLYRRQGNGWWAADDAARTPFQWVPDGALRGRLLGHTPQGTPGLLWGYAARILFSAARRFKRLFNVSS